MGSTIFVELGKNKLKNTIRLPLINPAPKTAMSLLRSPIPPRTTPIIDATPPRETMEPRSESVIPETPEDGQPSGHKLETAMPNNAIRLLALLGDAITELTTTRCSGNNQKLIENAKSIIEEAKHITLNLLKVDEDKRNKATEQMSKDLSDIKRLLAKPTPTFAQIAANEPQTCHHGIPTSDNKPNIDNKIKKQQREKLTITITATAAPDGTKNQLKSMHAKDLIQKCQNVFAVHFKEGRIPKIHGINKLSNDEYRFHCESEEDPQLLSKIDWSLIFDGVKVKKRKYGLVIHGVPKKDLDPTIIEDHDTLIEEIEEENTSRNLQAEQVIPLRRTQKNLNKITAHHSVVIFTHSMEAADECLKRGMFIKGRHYSPEKYTPELNITQCYKCYKFGHLAKHCKNKQKCGNCGNEDHNTADCTNNTKCVGCGDPHPAWHIECSKRDEEGNRLRALKRATTNYYSE